MSGLSNWPEVTWVMLCVQGTQITQALQNVRDVQLWGYEKSNYTLHYIVAWMMMNNVILYKKTKTFN